MNKPDIIKHPHLDERTIQFGILGMWICEQLPQGYAGKNVADQLFRSSTSVAANYAEASEPESNADFIHKMKIALKELKESRAWLRFASKLVHDTFIEEVIRESYEIQNMMGASIKKRGYRGWTSPASPKSPSKIKD
ncbi:MAG: four helix bundle protein [Kiritimatiellae bacterium]|nr:four helix bundle protein [Kiritimatiellia bacterium]